MFKLPTLANPLKQQADYLGALPNKGARETMKIAAYAMPLMLVLTGLIAFAPQASANCTVNVGTCEGDCPVNVYSTCGEGGSCLVNAVLASCSNECAINVFAVCDKNGTCPVNVFGTCKTLYDIQGRISP